MQDLPCPVTASEGAELRQTRDMRPETLNPPEAGHA